MVMTTHPNYTPHNRHLYDRLISQQLCSRSTLPGNLYHDLFTLELEFMAPRFHFLFDYLGYTHDFYFVSSPSEDPYIVSLSAW